MTPATLGTLLALSVSAFAQEKPLTTTRENADTAHIFVTGNMITDYVQRPHSVTAFTDSFSNPSGVPTLASVAAASGENTFEGELAIRFTAELNNKVTVVIEIGTRRADGDPAPGPGGINRFGDGQALAIKLREAHLLFPEVVIPELKAELGISTWKFNIRGKGGSLAFDPRRAQTITRNLDSDGILNVRDDGFNRFAEAAFVDTAQPVGGTVTYGSGPVTVDVVFLPTVNDEGGTPRNDDQLYAVDAMLGLDDLGKGSRAGIIFAISTARTALVGGTPGNTDARTKIYTVGGGSSLKLMEGLEAYLEAYTQMGQAGQLASKQRVAAGGHAAQAGVEWHYTVGNPLPFWAGLNFTHISGDSTDPADANNRKASRFAAYEGVNDLMILEDPFYGFDWDSNYQAVKVSGGASFTASRENDLDVMFVVGVTRAVNRVSVPTGGTENKLGDEVDVKATWHMTNQLALKVSLAYLWGSTLLEKCMGGIGNPNARDHAFLFVLGWDLSF
jgi:hypothetical protein